MSATLSITAASARIRLILTRPTTSPSAEAITDNEGNAITDNEGNAITDNEE